MSFKKGAIAIGNPNLSLAVEKRSQPHSRMSEEVFTDIMILESLVLGWFVVLVSS